MTAVKFNLRLPPELHQQAADLASTMGMSLNVFVTEALWNWVEYKGRRFKPGTTAARAGPTAMARVATPTMQQRDPSWPKVGRNDPCPCGSRKKAKLCHGTG